MGGFATLLTSQSVNKYVPTSAPTTPPAPKRERRKEARPGELLEAALALFVEKGYAATKVDEVAARAGVSKGVLRMLMEKALPLDLMQLLELARAQFDPEQIAASVALDVFQFMQDRLRVYLKDQGRAPDRIAQ